ncbi:MAG: restriction endonuclease [Burkholderiales bacterium]|nr:restriction endonuclease [Burkholderiales bacterium]
MRRHFSSRMVNDSIIHATLAAINRSKLSPAILASLEQQKANEDLPGILLQAVITVGDKTKEGELIESVAIPWFEIIQLMQQDPGIVYQLDWRKWEEIIAAAYKRQGFEVELTPRSNDKGRDVIATSRGVGCVRYFDQVKAYKPNNLVTANDVRALAGVLEFHPNVSKGVITTTSAFAPGIYEDEDIKRFMPYRLELKPKEVLLPWLASLAQSG